MTLHPILDGAAHHHFLLFGESIGIIGHAVAVAVSPRIEGLQRGWRSKLCSPVRLRAIDARHVHVGDGLLLCN